MRAIELEGVSNVRDLGGIPVEGGRMVVPGLLFRGSALYNITESDRDTLFDKLNIACIIDVRTGWERAAKPDIDIPGVENLHIPFYDLDKVGIEYTRPAAGTIMIGRDVACDPDHYYRSLINHLVVSQMREGMHLALDHAIQGKPVYIHCSGGKDRAGILVLLILTALGASRESILEDYLFTNVARDKNYEKMYQRFLRLADGNEERAWEITLEHRARPENLSAFYEAIEEHYGSMESFMRTQLDIDEDYRQRACQACTRPIG